MIAERIDIERLLEELADSLEVRELLLPASKKSDTSEAQP